MEKEGFINLLQAKQSLAHYYKAVHHRLRNTAYPVNLIWFVTEDCNLRCKYCFVVNETHISRKPLSIDIAKRFIENSGISKVTFTGGEPMIFKEFEQLLDKCFDLGIDVAICSNGFRSECLLKKLKERNKKVYLQVSLDGTKPVHNKIRGSNKAYDEAAQLISRGCADGHRVTIVVTVYSENFTSLEETLQGLAKGRLPVYINFVRSGDQVAGTDFIPVQKNDLSLEQIRQCFRLWEKYNAPYMNRLDRLVMRGKTEQVINYCQTGQWSYKCTAGINDAVLYPNGEVAVCEMKAPLGNIQDYGLDWAKFWQFHPQKLKTCYCQWDCAMIDSLTYSLQGVVRLVKHYVA